MSSVGHNNALYKIVVAHYLLAGLFFLVLSGMFLLSVETLSGHYFQPKILALTHTAALGWGTMIIFGALYQLLPVILETSLYSTRLSWFSLFFFLPGVILLVYCFWIFDPGLYMQIASLLVFIGITLFNFNVFFTIKYKGQESIFQNFIITSCVWLCLTALAGTLMVFNFQFSFFQKNHLHFLRLHAHMGIVGWFLMLIIGVSAKLVPMFLVSKYQKKYLLVLGYYFVNTALLLFLIHGYLFGINLYTYLILLTGALGIFFYLIYIFRCFKSRIRSEIDLPMLKTLFSFVLLTAGLSVLPFLLYYSLKNNIYALNLSVLFGTLIFMGWISALILGQTFKTLPFIVWIKHYEHLAGKVKIPLPAELINVKLLYVQVAAFLVFLTTFISGFLINSATLKMIGASSLIVTALCYCIHIVYLLLHKTKTQNYDRI